MQLGSWANDPLKRLAAALAVLTLVALILMFGKPSFSNASRPPLLGSAILSLQCARGVEDVDLILSDAPSPDREAMRIKTYIDFVLIPSYTALGIVLSVLLARERGWKQAAAVAAGICAAATGVFDVMENRATLQILDVRLRDTTQEMVNAIRGPALAKWYLAAITVVLLCAHFVPKSREA